MGLALGVARGCGLATVALHETSTIDLGWFRKLVARDPKAYDALLACAKLKRWPARTTICAAGDPASWLCAIQSGRVEVRLSSPDREKTLSLTMLGPGAIWGEMALTAPHVRTTEVRTLDQPVEARLILFSDLERLRRLHPEVDRVLVEVLIERVRRLSHDMTTLTLSPTTRTMVRRWVLDRARKDEDGWVHASQQAIGDSLGLHRDTVGDLLRPDFDAGRIVQVRKARANILKVPDRDALHAAIEADDVAR